MALSTFLLLGVERLRSDVRENFSQSVSGTDLIVGARTGPMQLLLYAVFRVGGATNNVRIDSLEAIAKHRAVAWMVPLSLGDSHRGFPVLATTPAYFEHFRYGDRQPLALAQGRPFSGDLAGLYEVVLGAEVAERLGYRLGDKLTLSHGGGGMPGAEHADKPFARGRHPAAHRHAGGPHAAHQPAGDGGHPPGLGGRRAAARAAGSRPNEAVPPTCSPSR